MGVAHHTNRAPKLRRGELSISTSPPIVAMTLTRCLKCNIANFLRCELTVINFGKLIRKINHYNQCVRESNLYRLPSVKISEKVRAKKFSEPITIATAYGMLTSGSDSPCCLLLRRFDWRNNEG